MFIITNFQTHYNNYEDLIASVAASMRFDVYSIPTSLHKDHKLSKSEKRKVRKDRLY